MREKGKSQETSFSAPPPSPRSITPLEIQQKEFTVSRLGGYRMREVDEFLDELTGSVQALTSDLERLRKRAGASPVVGSADLDDVNRQADEIIQRARDEAAAIVAEARERAASIAGAAAAEATAVAGSDQEREAVNAFLRQEKGFLQSLAELVQEHASSVKEMAKKARSATATPTESALAPETPVVVTDPEPAAVGREENNESAKDGSLRDLFWGEEN